MLRWLQVARVGEIADREWKVVSLNGSDVAVFNVDGEYFAIDNACAHFPCDQCAGSLESEGPVYPWRGSEHGTRPVDAQKDPYEGARSFPVRVRDGNIEVCEEAA